MSIQYKEFRGTKPLDYNGTPDRALSQLNEWRDKTPDVSLISIETVEFTHPSTMTSSGGYSFQCLRVWFEQ
jgi:hypothetical protein